MTRDEIEGLTIDRDQMLLMLMLYDMFQDTTAYMEKNYPDYKSEVGHVD